VYKGIWRNTEVAVKKLLSFTLGVDQTKEFQSEVSIMAAIRPHPNVLLCMGACTKTPPYCIVMEYVPGGSLKQLLNAHQVPLENMYQLLKDIANGLYHLHVEGIIHRDHASRNILVRETRIGFDPKIADFGLSRVLSSTSDIETTKSNSGPLRIMAPECILKNQYSIKSDVWSFGVLVTEVYSQQDPYPEINAIQVAGLVATGQLTPEVPSMAPSNVQQMVVKCCQFDASDRPTMQDICRMFSK